MTTADGTVHGVTQIVSSGTTARRWNLVLMSDGYRLAEIEKYFEHARQLMRALRATPPFDTLWHAINVFRVDVSSTDSGTDDPVTCPDDPPGVTGSGAVVGTYFDGTTCGLGTTRRLITVNGTTAMDVADAHVPDYDRIIVLVNTERYGGSGGNPVGAYAAAHTPTSDAVGVAIHEFGHSAFGLADEYSVCTPDRPNRHPGPEPQAVNVTLNTDRETLKWRNHVAATTPIPTTTLTPTQCSGCANPESPVPIGTVGLFEGADISHCGAYRPQLQCKMRFFSYPFCVVCSERIREVLLPYTTVEPTTLGESAAVAAPAVNRFFDPEGSISVTDVARDCPMDGASGTVVVSSRMFPQAPPGTPAAGQFGYSYTVDLTRIVPAPGTTLGIQRIEMDAGPIVRHSYAGGPTGPVEMYVVVQGGSGSVMPIRLEQTAAGRLVLKFHSLHAGTRTFSMGIASIHPPRPMMIRLVDTNGRSYDLEGRGPAFP
jgi:hypothetical protein